MVMEMPHLSQMLLRQMLPMVQQLALLCLPSLSNIYTNKIHRLLIQPSNSWAKKDVLLVMAATFAQVSNKRKCL